MKELPKFIEDVKIVRQAYEKRRNLFTGVVPKVKSLKASSENFQDDFVPRKL